MNIISIKSKLSYQVNREYYVTFKGSTAPMVDLGTYKFKDLNIGKITLEELFTNSYTEEIHESEHVKNDPKLLRLILDAKYEKENLHKVMENKCQ